MPPPVPSPPSEGDPPLLTHGPSAPATRQKTTGGDRVPVAHWPKTVGKRPPSRRPGGGYSTFGAAARGGSSRLAAPVGQSHRQPGDIDCRSGRRRKDRALGSVAQCPS